MNKFRCVKKYVYSEHLMLYSWASRFVSGKKVLDLGCGEGYCLIGVSLIAKEIVGIDMGINEFGRNVGHTFETNTYYCPTTFKKKNLEKELIDESCDVCFAFEFLEHIENPDFVLEQIKNVPLFIFSLPHNAPARQHKQVFISKQQVEDLIGKYFKNIDWWYLRHGVLQKQPFTSPARYIGICSN